MAHGRRFDARCPIVPLTQRIEFLSTLGRMPQTPTILGVMVLAGWCEGFGIALFVPVLELLTNPAQPSRFMTLMGDILSAVGLPLTLPVALALVTAFVIGGFALNYLQGYIVTRAKYRVVAELRQAVMAATFQADWSYLSGLGSGETINLLLKECERAAESLSHQVRFLACLVLLIAYASMAAFVSWPILILTGLLGAAILVVVSPLIHTSRRLGDELTQANRLLGFHAAEFLSAKRLVKVTAAENTILSRWTTFNSELHRVTFHADATGQFLQFCLLALPVIGLAGIILVSVEILLLPVTITLVVLTIVARMMPRLSQLQLHYQYYVLQLSAVGIVDEALTEGARHRESSIERVVAARPDWQQINFRAVSYRFPNAERAAVDGISFVLPRNALIALVGPSGAGKSTIIDLLAGLVHPGGGIIEVDGRDLASIDKKAWRQSIGYVTQDVVIFNDTLRNNLLFSHPTALPADIAEAIRIAHLEKVVASLPKGLDTILGEGGSVLSGGERQRVAIARALIGRPKLLLLDEATSALDNESESLVQQAIEEISHRMTIVLVAHRLSTARKADLILVIEGGRVVEAGSYADLLGRPGAFARLHDAQFVQ